MKYKLGDLGKITTGRTPKKNVDSPYGTEMKFLTPRDVSSTRYSFYTERYLSQRGIDELKNKIVKAPSISVTCIGSDMGKAIINIDNVISNQQINSISEFRKDIDYRYVYYVLYTMKEELLSYGIGNGSTMPILNKKQFSNIEISVPDIHTQRKVVYLLSSLDSKIELNNQMIATLEELAAVLFKRWFVDFEFPDENGNPYKSSGGKMVDSELGEIPEGWEVKQLNEICEVKDGTHDSPKQQISGYPLVTSKHLGNNKIDFETAKLISPEDYKKVNQRSKVDTDDILISMIGTVGRLYFVSDERINFAIKNIGLIKTSTLKEDAYFIFLQLSSDRLKKYVQTNQAGSTQQYISLTNLRKMPIILPEWNKLRWFNEITENISLEIRKVVDENANLIEIRNKILPRLLSGELEI